MYMYFKVPKVLQSIKELKKKRTTSTTMSCMHALNDNKTITTRTQAASPATDAWQARH